MKSKGQPDQSISSDNEVNPEDAGVKPAARRIAYKTVLAAVVIGILAISVLWMFVIPREGSQANVTLAPESDMRVHEASVSNGLQVAGIEHQIGKIDRSMAYISDRIDQGFESQQNRSDVVKNQLFDMTQDIKAIKVTIADQRETSQELGRQINEAISRLDTFINEIRVPKVVKRKSSLRQKPRPVKTPPFQIDAIDVWDDLTYVATSQAGRVAFLKIGEQQSGWKFTHIDRLKGQVSLQDPAGQVHSISLPR
ncbi:MAG: hypothetical protein GY792_32355 [Gammaproteobacteria bacterium]|nr:hypothetical protein [Gammaproteobacteria bacterium]